MFKRRRDEPEETIGAADGTPKPPSLSQTLSSGERRPEVTLNLTADNGSDLPPFRTAPSKEAPAMARSPFNPPPSNQPLSNPSGIPARPPVSPGIPNSQGASLQPGVLPPSNVQQSAHPGRQQERRTLVVGRGISLQGLIQDAERLVVEGTVEAQLLHAQELAVAPGGIFKGEVEVEDAEIAGTIDGAITARGNLVIRTTGRVIGTARCRRLQVEDGGQISGKMEMITEGPSPRGPDRAA